VGSGISRFAVLIQAIDNDEDVDALARQKRERKQKRIESKRKREASGLGDIPDSPASDVSLVKKRGRPSKSESVEPSVTSDGKGKKRQRPQNLDDSADSPAPAPKKSRGRGRPPSTNLSDPLEPKRRKQLNKIFEAVYDAVTDLTDEDGRDRAELFMELPDRREYRDYYAIIKRPISLEMIRKRIDGNFYNSLQVFKEDFRTIWQNARTYNEEGSLVVEDANALEVLLSWLC
jgi:ATP-dependent helicase STH1/SNF2